MTMLSHPQFQARQPRPTAESHLTVCIEHRG